MRALEHALRVQAARDLIKRRTRPVKMPRPPYPTNERLLYYKQLDYFVDTVQFIVRRELLPKLQAILDAHAATRPEARADDSTQPRVPKGSPHGGEWSASGAKAAAAAARKTKAAAKKAELLGKANQKLTDWHRGAQDQVPPPAALPAAMPAKPTHGKAPRPKAAKRAVDPQLEGTHAELATALEHDRAALAAKTLPSPFRSSGTPGAGPLEIPVAPHLQRDVNRAVGAHPAVLGQWGQMAPADAAIAAAAPQHAAKAKDWVDKWIGGSSVASANEAFSDLSTPGSWAQAQYAATQASLRHHMPELKAKGVVDREGYVTLHRGVRGEQASAMRAEFEQGGGEATVRLRKTSSWTESHSIAREDFALEKGEVLTQRVHHTRVLATWRTQSNSDIAHNEQREWVVIADADVMHVRRGK